MKIKAIIHPAEEGGYWAEVPALPGCITEGDTWDELLVNLKDAIEGWLEVANNIDALPDKSGQIPPSQGSSPTYPSRGLDGAPHRHGIYSTLSNYLRCCYISIGCITTFRTKMYSLGKFFFASYSLASGASLTG